MRLLCCANEKIVFLQKTLLDEKENEDNRHYHYHMVVVNKYK